MLWHYWKCQNPMNFILRFVCFGVKLFLENIFLYFTVFGGTKNNSQTKNYFGLTKKVYLIWASQPQKDKPS